MDHTKDNDRPMDDPTPVRSMEDARYVVPYRPPPAVTAWDGGEMKRLMEIGAALLDRLERTCARAEQLRDVVRVVTEDAEEKVGQLSSHHAAARQVLRELTEANIGGHETLRRMNESIQKAERAAAGSTEAADRLLAEFNQQAHALERQIRELQAKAVQIENSVAEAATGPAELVTAAQSQAAHLERICSAVRKVFGGISQAAREAKQQTDYFNRASTDATRRLTSLKAETERASNTLREWVEEALRVQTRLDRALQQAPSISQTHPVNVLTSLSRTATPAPQIANSSAGGEMTLVRESLLAPPSNVPSPEHSVAVASRMRADEVARLIEDARRATGPT